jgi:hypothetical protein
MKAGGTVGNMAAFPNFPNKLFARSLRAFSTFLLYLSKTLQRLSFMENGLE